MNDGHLEGIVEVEGTTSVLLDDSVSKLSWKPAVLVLQHVSIHELDQLAMCLSEAHVMGPGRLMSA